jgi:hypothetical protein
LKIIPDTKGSYKLVTQQRVLPQGLFRPIQATTARVSLYFREAELRKKVEQLGVGGAPSK